MTFSNLLATATLAVVLSASTAWAGYKRIQTEDQFHAQIVGATLVTGNGSWVKLKRNGKVTGKTGDGRKIAGKWAFQNGMYCRTLKVAGKARPADCLLMELDGSKLRFRRNMGKGKWEHGVLK